MRPGVFLYRDGRICSRAPFPNGPGDQDPPWSEQSSFAIPQNGERMKILVSQNDERFGPLLEDELRDMVYRGDVKRTALARVEGEPDWVSVDTLLTRPESRPPVRVPPKVVI